MSIQYPINTDYEKALRKGGSIFNTLNDIELIPSKTHPIKYYTFGAGAYAIVFKGRVNNQIIALRCFQTSTSSVEERYTKIQNYFSRKNPSWFVECDFMDNEILVNNDRYPILKMGWVTGKPLNDYIDGIISNDAALSVLQIELVALSNSLERYKTGHGDIQTGNVFINEEGSGIKISLVDYDNMYIPELESIGSKEKGLPQFQHPARTKSDYNHKIDRFSIWVCVTALEALKNDNSLWNKKNQGGFNTGENMLFEGDDFQDPDTSSLFKKLINGNNNEVANYAEKLKEYSLLDSLLNIPKPKLLDGTTSLPRVKSPDKKPERSSSTPLTLRKGDQIYIQSKPSGATVLNNKLNKIGITPLAIDKTLSENKILHLTLDDKRKDVNIETVAKNDIIIDFNEKKIPQNPVIIPQKIIGKPKDSSPVAEDPVKGKTKTDDIKTIEFKVSPGGSSIVINDKGCLSTRSSYIGKFKKDEKLLVTISKQGYKTKSFTVLPNDRFPYRDISLIEKSNNEGWVTLLATTVFVLGLILFITHSDPGSSSNKSKITQLQNQLSQKNREITNLSSKLATKSSSDINKYYPVTIKDVYMGNSKHNGDIINAYGSYLYENTVRFLKPKIVFINNMSESRTIKLSVKHYDEDGELRKIADGPEGYTSDDDYYITSYDDELKLRGWGNGSRSIYNQGTHQIEIWYDGRILYSKIFRIR